MPRGSFRLAKAFLLTCDVVCSVRFQGVAIINRCVPYRLPLSPIEVPLIVPFFHEPFDCWRDIPS